MGGDAAGGGRVMGVMVCLVMIRAGPGWCSGGRGWCSWVVFVGRDGGLVTRGWRGGVLVWGMGPG